jgi:hypothetical protein
MFDTFHDERRAYVFASNPFGIQLDQLYAENSGFNDSFDTVWDSVGKITPRGYVVLMEIPSRSLRFPQGEQSWGVILQRTIPRLNENSFWPRVSNSIDGLLNQEGVIDGVDIGSAGHNIQVTPYGAFRAFRALDSSNPAVPVFETKAADSRVGLESKLVVKDRLIFDIALHPDFSQVESDDPQVTADQRFPVFFPEKRQFFLENSSFFDTPIRSWSLA